VHGFIEKPTITCQVSMGVYVYDERALRFLPEGQCQFPDLVLRLLEAGERVAAFQSDADWFDIGTMGEYERASADVERFPEKYGIEPLAAQQPDILATLDTPEA
jgi:NDP-sugar pyrophosphorylase family protein